MSMDINVADELYEEVLRLREKSLDIPDETTSRVLYQTLRIMEEMLVAIPKSGARWEDDDEDDDCEPLYQCPVCGYIDDCGGFCPSCEYSGKDVEMETYYGERTE